VVGEQARGGVAIAGAKFPPRPVAIGVDGSLGHAKFTRDLFGTQVTVDKAQTVAFALGQPFNKIVVHVMRLAHRLNTVRARA
jgi:hypothetical protein